MWDLRVSYIFKLFDRCAESRRVDRRPPTGQFWKHHLAPQSTAARVPSASKRHCPESHFRHYCYHPNHPLLYRHWCSHSWQSRPREIPGRPSGPCTRPFTTRVTVVCAPGFTHSSDILFQDNRGLFLERHLPIPCRRVLWHPEPRQKCVHPQVLL